MRDEWGIVKHQDENQLKGRWGELIAALAFPAHWVVRALPHDYGVDLQVEVFNHAPAGERGKRGKRRKRFVTTGGHFSCQVKTSDAVRIRNGVAELRMPTTDLRLAEGMGPTAPLVLLLVDRPNQDIYYLCLADYIKYVLEPGNSDWRSRKSSKVRIPSRNRLSDTTSAASAGHIRYLRSLAYRAKLYGACFALLHAQREMEYQLERWQGVRERGTVAEMKGAAARLEEWLDAGRSACGSLSTLGLTGSGAPYSGLLAAATRWAEQFGSEWAVRAEAIRALDEDLDPGHPDVGVVVMEFDECAFSAVCSFDVTTAAARTFEGVHRRERLDLHPPAIDQ
ncbi:DUF4365 domain-containing protein [Microbacterium sp. E-13]|uniref:DUF4365 domain-containing protein n=1 Tax=Microbacterium sp. E-13 TaxID=3404048 RepID=UPI003CEFED0D